MCAPARSLLGSCILFESGGSLDPRSHVCKQVTVDPSESSTIVSVTR